MKDELLAKVAASLEKRQMKGYVCKNGEEAKNLILSLIPEGSRIGFGGSKTMTQIGVMEAVQKGPYHFLDRDAPKDREGRNAVYAAIQTADVFLMSSNAITEDGVLVNVDGRSDRVSFLCHGPRKVIIAVGCNKVVPDVEAGLDRIWKVAGPQNARKLNRNTGCLESGVCNQCLSPECVCSNIVITRRSAFKERIHVVLIGEELGF